MNLMNLSSFAIALTSTNKMAEYYLWYTFSRLLQIDQEIRSIVVHLENIPATLDLLRFADNLQLGLLVVQRTYLMEQLNFQIFLALLWIIFFE